MAILYSILQEFLRNAAAKGMKGSNRTHAFAIQANDKKTSLPPTTLEGWAWASTVIVLKPLGDETRVWPFTQQSLRVFGAET
jgi:hypothetical protein